MEDLDHFLNYCATNPEAKIIYRTSDIQLMIDSDAAYLVPLKARSGAAGYHYLVNRDRKLFQWPNLHLRKINQISHRISSRSRMRRPIHQHPRFSTTHNNTT